LYRTLSCELCNKCSAVFEIGDRLATTDKGQKEGVGLLCPFWRAGWHNVAWAEVYLPTKWHLDPSSRLATTDMGQNLGLYPIFGEGLDSI